MASQGHIKIDRRILNWEWYGDSNMVHVFLHLLLTANYSDSRFQGILVKRGQVIIGRVKLASLLGLSEMQIRTCLNKLKSTNEISIKTTNKFSIVTICKYDDYQSKQDKDNQQNNQQHNQQITNQQPTDNQQLTTSNNSKEEEVNNKKKEIDLVFPFKSDLFISSWKEWIEYKKVQHKFSFKSKKYEQKSLNDLFENSSKNESIALKMISKAISSGWKGLFKLDPKDIPKIIDDTLESQRTEHEDFFMSHLKN
jgi:hypothetical protein